MELKEYLPFWEQLNDDERKLMEQTTVRQQVRKGDILHQAGSGCTGLLLVLSGQIRVYTVSEEGKELTLYRLLERDICLFSAACILPGIQFAVTAEAETDAEVLVIVSDSYKQIMRTSAAAANYTNALMASHFSDVMWLMDQILNKKMGSRLAALLLEESELRQTEHLTITHEQLAGHLGSMREVISRLLKYFQEEQMVRLGRGSITITDRDRLEAMAERSRR